MTDKLSDKIEIAYNTETPRPFYAKGSIGASAVGNSCDAYLSLSLRGFPEEPIDAQLKRIFRDGHRIEIDVLKDIQKAGVDVTFKDEFTGKQFKWVKYGGHAVFKSDGLLSDGKVLLEIKSMNNALWTKFKGYGIKISHPHYYDQMQMGMGLSGIQSCVMLAYNKDKSTYHDELVEFDPIRWGFLSSRIDRAIAGDVEKIGRDETDWRCRECPKRGACWGLREIPKTVRTCAHSSPDNSGGFTCPCGGDDTKGCLGSYEQFKPKERSQ